MCTVPAKMIKIHFWLCMAPLIPFGYIIYQMDPQSERKG